MTLKNDLILKALSGKPVPRAPVWMMRQAGRYLPEYLKLKDKYDFFTRIETPELACEITLQPIKAIEPDAAIIFSDILVVPKAMGMKVYMVEGKGPILPETINNNGDIQNLQVIDSTNPLKHVYKAITLTKRELNGKVPLIGFAGGPFTLLCYMLEGKSSKTFDKSKSFCFSQPELAHQLLEKITESTIAHLKFQVSAGADCIQLFDSWSGLLSREDFRIYALPYLSKIALALSPFCPVILFPKGSWYALAEISQTTAAAVGVDWCTPPELARKFLGDDITIQGSLDPSKLLLAPEKIKDETKQMLLSFGKHRYIANLGHGILPNTPVDNVKSFVDTVKEYTY